MIPCNQAFNWTTFLPEVEIQLECIKKFRYVLTRIYQTSSHQGKRQPLRFEEDSKNILSGIEAFMTCIARIPPARSLMTNNLYAVSRGRLCSGWTLLRLCLVGPFWEPRRVSFSKCFPGRYKTEERSKAVYSPHQNPQINLPKQRYPSNAIHQQKSFSSAKTKAEGWQTKSNAPLSTDGDEVNWLVRRNTRLPLFN